ncbi:MAG TPA: nuclear transport factor 2 family protein [Flavitalea sp.]|nr:nuclear transport factor 2 family protein [Flavitalea sp.]
MNTETLLFKLKAAFNTHDIDAFVACFDEDYHSEQPVHPDRRFNGRDHVRKNWASNFDEMPDFSAQLLRYTINNDEVWTEWEWQGTRKDTSKLLMCGVMIFQVQDAKITWARLYVEPVDVSGKGIEAAVEEVMHGKKVKKDK